MNKPTICELCTEALTLYENNPKLTEVILVIKERAEAMEDRLLKYCNAIEDLGFSRDGRNYDEQ